MHHKKEQRTILVFVVITLFNILIYTYHIIPTKSKFPKFSCSIQNYMETLSEFVTHNGEKSISEHLPPMCFGKAPSEQSLESFRQAFKDLSYKCSQQRPIILDMEIKKPILTLFTSLAHNKDKNTIYSTTIQNWSTFLPKINLILFTNDSSIKASVESRGWTVFPVTHHAAGGVPVLKTMFEKARKTYDTPFYGFSNADILFTDKLLETVVVSLKNYGKDTKMMITGRRYNIPTLTPKEAMSYENIRTAINTRGELFMEASEDFLITSKPFSWENVPDLVIGRPAYDNWVVAHARCSGITAIDATYTVQGAHQTTSVGNREGWNNKFTNYNIELLEKAKKTISFNKGFAVCPEIKTFFNLCGNIQTGRKHNIPNYCKC